MSNFMLLLFLRVQYIYSIRLPGHRQMPNNTMPFTLTSILTGRLNENWLNGCFGSLISPLHVHYYDLKLNNKIILS